jgi:hypothetical protein
MIHRNALSREIFHIRFRGRKYAPTMHQGWEATDNKGRKAEQRLGEPWFSFGVVFHWEFRLRRPGKGSPDGFPAGSDGFENLKMVAEIAGFTRR